MKANNKKSPFSIVFWVVLLLVVFSCFFLYTQAKKMFTQGALEKKWSLSVAFNITSHALSQKGNYIAIGSETGEISVYTKDGNQLLTHTFTTPILDLQFSFDESCLLVKGYSVYCMDLAEKRVVWEKFYEPDQNYIQDFWVFSDGKIGFLSTSLTNLDQYYFLTNSEGITIETPKKLPSTPARYELTPSPDGKLLAWTTEKGTIECISYFGFVHWNRQLSFPDNQPTVFYPFFQDISNAGNMCVSYRQPSLSHLFFVNIEGVTLWETELKDEIHSIEFSAKEDLISVSTNTGIYIYDLSGNLIHAKKEYGYDLVHSSIYYSNHLTIYTPKEKIRPHYLDKDVIELHWLDKTIWRKHADQRQETVYSVTDNGYNLLEISRPHQITLYQFRFFNNKRKV